MVVKHLHHVARLQRRAYAAADGAAAIGGESLDDQAHRAAYAFKQAGQFTGLFQRFDLAAAGVRNVNDHMRRACGEFFGQDGGHRPIARVQPEGPHDRVDGVVQHRMIELAVPGNAAVGGQHAGLDLVEIQVNARQYFHGIRSARR